MPLAPPSFSSIAQTPHYELVKSRLPDWIATVHPDTHAAIASKPLPAMPWYEKALRDMPELVAQFQQAHELFRHDRQQVDALLARIPAPEAFARPLLEAAIKRRFELDLDTTQTFLFNARRVVTGPVLDFVQDADIDFDTFQAARKARHEQTMRAATCTLLQAAMQNFEAWEAEHHGMDNGDLKADIYMGHRIDDLTISGTPVGIAAHAFAQLCRELNLGRRYQECIDVALNWSLGQDDAPDSALANTRAQLKLFERAGFVLQTHIAYMKGDIDAATHQDLLRIARTQQAERCSALTLFQTPLNAIVLITEADTAEGPSPRLTAYIPDDPYHPLKTYESKRAFVHALRANLLKPHYLAFIARFVPAPKRAHVFAALDNALHPKTWDNAGQQWLAGTNPQANIKVQGRPFTAYFLEALVEQKLATLKADGLFHLVTTEAEDRKTHDEHVAYIEGKFFMALNIAAFVVPGLGEALMVMTAVELCQDLYEGFDNLVKGDRDAAMGYLLGVAQEVASLVVVGAAAHVGTRYVLPRVVAEMKKIPLPNGLARLWKPDLAPFQHEVVLPANLRPDAQGLYRHQDRLWLKRSDGTFAIKPPEDGKPYRLEHPSKSGGYEPPLRSNGKGAWISETDDPGSWEGTALFRRMGHATEGISDTTAKRIMRVSDTHEAVLRRTLADAKAPPALLLDTLLRFQLDQDLATVISQLEATLPAADPRLQLQLLSEHPRWPANKGLRLDSADGEVIEHFTAPQETTILVFEGDADVLATVLDSLPAQDVHNLLARDPGPYGRLLLRQQLLDYARSRRSQLFDQRYSAAQASQDSAAALLQLHFPDLPAAIAEELAAHASPEERAMMGNSQQVPSRLVDEAHAFQAKIRVARAYEGVYLDSVDSADARQLREYVLATPPDGLAQQPATLDAARNGPLPPRRKVQELLQMSPEQPGAKSPMALAAGRAGLAVGPGPRIVLEESLLDKIRLLELEAPLNSPARTILDQLYGAGLDRETIDTRLNHLFDEQQALQAHLDQWGLESAAAQRLSPARQRSRLNIGEALWRLWRTTALAEVEGAAPTLRLDNVYLNDLPTQLPEFLLARVRQLELNAIRPRETSPDTPAPLLEAIQADRDAVAAFFARFPHLQTLAINEGGALGPYSLFNNWTLLITEHFPQLSELRLVDLRLPLGSARLDELRRLTRLRRLDLSGNRFYEQPDFASMDLDFLGLDRLSDEWSEFQPDLFTSALLDHTRELSLRGNRLLALPEALLQNPAGNGRTTRLVLTDNQLNHETMRTAIESEHPGGRYTFETDLPRASVEATLAQQRALESAVADWRDASSSSAPPSAETLATRRAVGHTVSQFWRTFTLNNSAPVLELNGHQVAAFPLGLPDFFYQEVTELSLNDAIATPEQLDRLLRAFPRAQHVAIDGTATPMAHLPGALLALPELRSLALIDQGLRVDQALMDRFARIPGLQHLSLDGNTLGAIEEVSALRNANLELLSLERMGISTWPHWLDTLIPDYLGRINLNENNLTRLPEHILANHRRDTGHTLIELRGNPLSYDTMHRAHVSESYYRPYAFDMDLPEDIAELTQSESHDSDGPSSSESRHSSHSPGLSSEGEPPSVGPWLDEAAEASDPARSTWKALEEDGSADDLLKLINRLRQTADYRGANTRPTLVQRVWNVLDQVAIDPELRLLLNGMAEEPLRQLTDHATCPDGVRLAFNQMEVQVFTRLATRTITGEQRGLQLQNLVRRLYRLQALDELAIRNTGARDEAEVRLAYRLHLARPLDLPIPPARMLFESSADLRPGELNEARSQVNRSEQGQPFLDFAADQSFWSQYLREAHAERFQALRQDYEAQVLALTDRYPDETMDQVGVRIKTLEQQLKANERELIKHLTNLESQSQG